MTRASGRVMTGSDSLILEYIYDSTFEGLLTCIFEAYYRREEPDRILCGETVQRDMLSRTVHIETDLSKADRVLESIRARISGDALDNAFHAYLSEYDDIGVWIYRYLKLGWKVGPLLDSYLHEVPVQKVHETAGRVRYEAHRMLGLLRFRQLEGGAYYAPMGPDHNVLSLIAPHFADRLSDQSWMIHDVKRDIAAVYNKQDWVIAVVRQKKALPLHGDELEFQRLWKQYFQSIAIAGRKNPRLQRQHMPSRYWKYLVEKQA